MKLNRYARGVAATAGVLGLLAGAAALAESETVAQAGAESEPAPTESTRAPGALGEMLDSRSAGNDDAEQVQKQIDEVSDATSELLSKYRTALKQIDAIDLYNGQMRNLIASQEAEIASISEQLDRVENVGRSVTPLMMRMIDAIDQFVELDIPFLIEERRDRVAELRDIMNRANVSTAGKFRQIMEAYQIENEYGRTIEAYRSTLALEGRETRVDFLRFGRIALVYQSLDETQAGVWDQESRSWKPLDRSHRSAIRAGLRIARKQTAPDLITLPLPAAVAARGSS
jgi:hypothetical protein